MLDKESSIFFTDRETLESYSLSNQFAEHLEFILVKDKNTVKPEDMYYSLSMSVRDRLVRKWLRTQHVHKTNDVKRVYYLSLEFLVGRLLSNALINMNYYDECREILKKDKVILEDIIEEEHDMALGNGGLGRLAACYLDSMATLELPAYGYGIRYEYGIFRQEIENGNQMEQPDNWLSYGNPWEIFRRDLSYKVKFFGTVHSYQDDTGKWHFDWVDTEDVLAVAYDVPVPGYDNNTVNNLRLWQAKATQEFSFKDFNSGNYLAAVENKNLSENISKVLYPNDTYTEGKYLRLKQQYFFVSASLQDIIRKFQINHRDYKFFAEKTAIQLNDTHPVIAIPELMRILMDQEKLGWDEAWKITVNTFAYTNHTVVPEALEEWPVDLMDELLPRHLQIIYEINQRFLDELRLNYNFDDATISKLSLIREGSEKKIRMANLAIIGSHAVNGVAALHTQILKDHIFPHFYKFCPEKFVNVTNGITPRRWLKAANPFLANMITDRIGDKWVKNLADLKKLEKAVKDSAFLENWRGVKWSNKLQLIDYIQKEHYVIINPESIFDVQVKRFHEYKRQLLNVLHVITLYNRIKDNPDAEFVPRTVIFAGKAAPAYHMAKLIIKLINCVAEIINNDPDVGDKLKLVFLKNYSVSLAEKIIPASDLSEQISTAGLEASGTGNMKFALNGALTIGTMDGANIEIREEVGDDNIFIFGLLADEVIKLKASGYNPREYYEGNQSLKRVIDMISNNYFNRLEPGIFKPIVDNLLNTDYYCLFADYPSYINTQDQVSATYLRKDEWTTKSILNVARIGKFSSDRSISEYAKHIWNVKPIKIQID
ncbi:MAG: glycogen/starch/alpha-glucan phosphorylase [Ignavibacteriaceae bacterium]|nr:glycogen/starch/alpha-glucan phosphorylase [Ignavibacteriaceae bacterium]